MGEREGREENENGTRDGEIESREHLAKKPETRRSPIVVYARCGDASAMR